MSDHCETVGSVLGPYAEGELQDPRTVELVREHLLGCADCRDALELYDALTRTLLAGEPERLPCDGVGCVDLERERRVEGVLRRLNWSHSAVTEESALNGSRAFDAPVHEVPAGLERRGGGEKPFPFGRPGRPRLRLSLDELAPRAGTADGASDARRAPGSRRFALAAAALLCVSVWLAGMLSGLLPGNAPVADRQALLDPPHASLPLVASSGQAPYDLASPRREVDRSLHWVVRDEGPDPRFRFAPSRAPRSPSEPELLYGVGYRRDLPARSSTAVTPPPSGDVEIEWVVEVIIDSPPKASEVLSEPRYLLVPVVSELADSSRPGRLVDAGGVWFRPGRIERRRARGASAQRLAIENSTVCRVCVYEGIRRLELPDRSWTPVEWRTPSTFRGPAHERVAPRPLPTFTWRPDLSREPDPRF